MAADDIYDDITSDDDPKVKVIDPSSVIGDEDPPAGGGGDDDPPAGEGDPPAGDGGGQGDPPPGTGKEPKKPDVDYLSKINTKFGTSFESIDDFESSDLHERISKASQLEKELSDIKDQIDPLSYFANEGEYVRQQLLKSHPEYDPAILSRVVNSDLEKMTPQDAIAYQMMLEDPEIFTSKEQALRYFGDEMNIDFDEFDINELEEIQKVKILKKAKEAKKQFTELRSSVEIPKKEDVVAKRAEAVNKLKDEWKPLAGKITASMDAVKVPMPSTDSEGKPTEEVFEFDMDKKYVETLNANIDKVVEDLAKKGIPPSEDAINAVVNEFKSFFVLKNLPKIISAYHNEQVQKMSVEEFHELHNPRSPEPGKQPPGAPKTPREISLEKAEEEIMRD